MKYRRRKLKWCNFTPTDSTHSQLTTFHSISSSKCHDINYTEQSLKCTAHKHTHTHTAIIQMKFKENKCISLQNMR